MKSETSTLSLKSETSTLSLIEDAEDLKVDTRKMIVSSNDVYTSFEIVEEDLTLAMKNLKEFQKIYTTLMIAPKVIWRFIVWKEQQLFSPWKIYVNRYQRSEELEIKQLKLTNDLQKILSQYVLSLNLYRMP